MDQKAQLTDQEHRAKNDHHFRTEHYRFRSENYSRAEQSTSGKAQIASTFHWRVALPALVAATILALLLADPLRLSPVAHLPFDPVVIDIAPPPPRSVKDPLNRLADAEIMFEGEAFGPESIAWDLDGRGPYAGVGDGRVVRRTADGRAWETFAWASPLRTPDLCDTHAPRRFSSSSATSQELGPMERRHAAAAAATLPASERVATAFGVFPSDVSLVQPHIRTTVQGSVPGSVLGSVPGSLEGPAGNHSSPDVPSEETQNTAASPAAQAANVESSQQNQLSQQIQQSQQSHQAQNSHQAQKSQQEQQVQQSQQALPNPSMEHICGRPLGLRFHPVTGELFFADAYFGVFKVGRQGGLAQPVVTRVDGRPLLFANDLDIAASDENGTLYFTDTSTRFHRRDYYVAIVEGRADGRLLQVDLTTGQAAVLVVGLAFANGVALSRDKSFLVFCETTTLRCHRYWLRGPKAGTREVFVDLPGMPDNVRLNPRGRFWIAVHSRRKFLLDMVAHKPWLRSLFLSLPISISTAHRLSVGRPNGIIVEVDENGTITDVLEDRLGSAVRYAGEVFGPESLAWDLEGRGPYAGVSDGRIVRRSLDDSGWETFAHASPHWSSKLCDPVAPVQPSPFASALAYLSGAVEASADASNIHTRSSLNGSLNHANYSVGPISGLFQELDSRSVGSSSIASAPSIGSAVKGRVGPKLATEHICGRPLGLRFHPVTGELFFADAYFGIYKVGKKGGKARVVVDHVEGRKLRCSRYWLKGPKEGTQEVLVDLPGSPDNIRLNPRGRFWVAMHSRRRPLIDYFAPRPWLRSFVMSLPVDIKIIYGVMVGWPHGLVVEVDGDGRITDVLEDHMGRAVKAVSEVEERNGTLWANDALKLGSPVAVQSTPFLPLRSRTHNLRKPSIGLKSQACRLVKTSAAVAAPVSNPLSDPQERERLAEEYGFRQIGEPLPDDITLKQVIDTIPAEAFEINEWKAWKTVFLTIAAMAIGEVFIYYSPWYLLPFAWAWAGTAFTGFFVVGHDCAHKAFSKNKLVEDIVGTVMMAPLIYPYEPWRFKHDRHHAKTNMLVEDTAWHPMIPGMYKRMSPTGRVLMQTFMGPLRFLASIGHWLVYHFDLGKFRPSELPRVKVSLAAVGAFAVIGFPLIIANFGIDGWFKMWLMPWLGFHFWMSTFTMVHHTAPHIPFKKQSEWNAAQAQLGGTVHCDYPSWIEILCHDINVHIPHHVSQKIPSYNLRLANDALRKHWGKYMNEATWNWRLMKNIFVECHVFDREKNYIPFDALEKSESPILGLTRKIMPNTFNKEQ
ncbi:unnamed protein product [Closterium sp. NIES-64]|nr:unnamed protein product [Closterium sp. NIES-64]